MKLNGNYVIHTRIGGAAFSEVIDGQPCVIASFDNSETAQALLGVITSAVAQQGGSLFDADRGEFIAGSLDQLVAA